MKLNHPRALTYVILAGGILPLGFALVAQYVFKLPPCHFCLLQRYPYLLVIASGLALRRFPKEAYLMTAFAIIGWLTTAGFGIYHTGIEEGWVAYSGGCVSHIPASATGEALLKQIVEAPRIACDAPMGTFLGLSMASWNAVAAFGWVALTLSIYRRRT